MRRAIVLGMLVAAGALSLTVRAMQPPQAGGGQQAERIVEVEKFREFLDQVNPEDFAGGAG